MKTLFVILLVICVVGLIGLTISEINDNTPLIKLYWGVIIVSGLSCINLGIVLLTKDYSTPKEFPASRYTLKLKITEFEQQKDTTYVLIPKEK